MNKDLSIRYNTSKIKTLSWKAEILYKYQYLGFDASADIGWKSVASSESKMFQNFPYLEGRRPNYHLRALCPTITILDLN